MSSSRKVLAPWSIAALLLALPMGAVGGEELVLASLESEDRRESPFSVVDGSFDAPLMSVPSDLDEFTGLGISRNEAFGPSPMESVAAYDPLSGYDRLLGDSPRIGDDSLFDDEFDLDLAESTVSDPMEDFNRGVFVFNEALDTVAWDPMTRGYRFLMPKTARRGVHRFFMNLESPVVFANQVLQFNITDAGVTLGRFVMNSTVGIAGLFDPAASAVGLERVDADFGQTLARYGVPSGAYLMVPLLGPSNVRDFSGDLVDRLLDPLTYLVGPIQWWIVLGTSQGLAEREAHIGDLNALEASSIDFYSALRSAHYQSRLSEVRRARGEESAGFELASDAAL